MKRFNMKLTRYILAATLACVIGIPVYAMPAFAKAGPLQLASLSDQDLKKGLTKVVRPGEIKFTTEYGRITEVYDSGSDKLVVHIQDAHTNYEAQKNAAFIIEDLIKNYGLYLILVEGGSRDVSLNYYRENSTIEARKEMAEKSLKEGAIAGEEYLNIVSDYPMKLQGIEDRALYDRNMEAYLSVDKDKDSAMMFASALTGAVNTLKFKVYSKELKELDEKRIGFKEEKVGLNEYVQYLDKLSKERLYGKKNWFTSGLGKAIFKCLNLLDRYSIPTQQVRAYFTKAGISPGMYNTGVLSDCRNFNYLINSIELEKIIDFTAVEKERSEIIEVISKRLGQDELNDLLAKSIDFRNGRMTPAQYHNYLNTLIAALKIDTGNYPNLDKYIRYVSIYEKIDSAKLFKELKVIEDMVARSFITNEDQRRLLTISKDLELLADFISLKLSPDDFEYYQSNEANFNIVEWVRFLNVQMVKYKLGPEIRENLDPIQKVMPGVKDFYLCARQRDQVFLANTIKYMDAERVNIAVLIAGGFHTPPVTRLLKENKVSYIVVSPKVVKQTDEKLYHKILTEGWAPSEGAAVKSEE